jgi:SAM-dependent methyltransferase
VRTVCCYNCGNPASEPFADENGYHLVKCISCGLLYVNPRPDLDHMSLAVRTGVHTGNRRLITTGHHSNRRLRPYETRLADLFGADLVGRDITWLDLGCGHGEFVEALLRFTRGGVRPTGYEPNERKVAAARARGLSVSSEYPNEHARFDVVSALNVYSHLDNPRHELGRWAALLLPGGELLLETGDTAEMSAAQHPKPFQLPDHVSFASERIIRELLNGLGFDVVCVKKYPPYSRDIGALAREVTKAVMPNRSSQWREFARSWYQPAPPTDMWVRARLRG